MHFASYYRWLVYQHLFGTPDPTARASSRTTILDIGCDDGGFVERLPADLSIALDPALPALHRARAQVRVCASGVQMPFHEIGFEHVILSDVIEHVVEDYALVASATACVKLNGLFWLSTTASQFQLFPGGITWRAERSWHHVRKGYTPAHIIDLIGDEFDCHLVEWSEVALRHSYLLLWASSKRFPELACRLAELCFQVDKRLPDTQPEHGHIYVQARRHTQHREEVGQDVVVAEIG